MKQKKYFILLPLVIILFTTVLNASYDFTLNKFGVRALGMGGAYTAIAEGPECIFYNNAKKPAINRFYTTIENGTRLGEPFFAISAQSILDIESLRVGYLNFSVNNISETILNNKNHTEATGESLSYGIHSLYLGWTTALLGNNIGLIGNYYQETIKSDSGKSLSLSLATHKYLNKEKTFSLGLTAKNIANNGINWSTGCHDTIDPTYIIGTNIKLFNSDLNLCADIECEKTISSKTFYGIEYWLMGSRKHDSSFVLRSGIRNQDFTLGLGLYMDGVLIDYAYAQPQKGFLENEHRFSVSWSAFNFLPTKIKDKKPIDINQLIQNSTGLDSKFAKSSTKKYNAPNTHKLKQGPKLQTLFELSLIDNDTINISLENASPSTNIVINDLPLKIATNNTSNKLTKLPIELRIYSSKNNKACILNIQKTNANHLTFDGFLAPNYKLLINSELIQPKNNGQVYLKILQEKLVTLKVIDLLIFQK